jgi:hypothetical protein
MAGKHRFMTLLVHGEKIGKFKQDVLLPSANATLVNEQKLLSDEDWETVRTGACLTITMMWLRLLGKGQSMPYDKLPNSQNQDLIRLAASAGKGHAKLKGFSASSSAHDIRMHLAKTLQVPLSEQRCITDTTFERAMKAVVVLPVGHGALVSSKVYRHSDSQYIGRHATGFHVNSATTLRFFDPNVGEYEVLLKEVPAFFEEYRKILASELNQSFVETDLYMAKLT